MSEWYARNLGSQTSEFGTKFEWQETGDAQYLNIPLWIPDREGIHYITTPDSGFIISYRVENLISLVDRLKASNTTILGEIEPCENRSVVYILDPEGNKVELWENTENVGAD